MGDFNRCIECIIVGEDGLSTHPAIRADWQSSAFLSRLTESGDCQPATRSTATRMYSAKAGFAACSGGSPWRKPGAGLDNGKRKRV